MLQGIQHNITSYHIACSKGDALRMVPTVSDSESKYLTLDLQADKKKYSYKHNPYCGPQAASIARRNARERNRVKQVNDGFNELRKRLPGTVIAALSGDARRGSGKKLSKVDTLKMVVEYIKYLQNLIDESDAAHGITRPIENIITYEVDDKMLNDSSPYSDSVPSPNGSDCSSGVSSSYSSSYNPYNYQVCEEQVSHADEDDLLDAITWWQQK